MKQYLKLGFAVAILTLAAGCSTSMVAPLPAPQSYMLDSNSYKALGRVSVVVQFENYDNMGVYEALVKAAKKVGGNDVINIYIDTVEGSSKAYHASGLAIKHK